MKKKNNDLLVLIKQTARNTVPMGGKAILYGSRARGDSHNGSDWDVLILLNKSHLEPSDYDNVSFPFVMLGWENNQMINPIMYTLNEWETYSDTPFYKNVSSDGIVLTS